MFLLLFYMSNFIFGTCVSFLTPINSTNDMKTLERIHSEPKKVVLFTGNGCRACINFKKKFNRLSEEYPTISMFEVVLNDLHQDDKLRRELLKFSNEMGVTVVPTVLIEDGDESFKFPGARGNYKNIEDAVFRLNTLT